ncbi:hypothetical protein EDEG_02226 [Edhazardia aedis USNM 41457]|uniref:Uncharacterized protein n=1 Tax=Edhazardia aedis (strain USNM 41457) TaxID=1003232 RepID=J9D6Q1_EDHAE|nr:hypothetical protein EDEG_02226 [Edhazardia aedis USNM 41457]|eukprot:EJW03461.1 hypothetical protein EDEG_02226 [Edhazardia aedis USNM 41457]
MYLKCNYMLFRTSYSFIITLFRVHTFKSYNMSKGNPKINFLVDYLNERKSNIYHKLDRDMSEYREMQLDKCKYVLESIFNQTVETEARNINEIIVELNIIRDNIEEKRNIFIQSADLKNENMRENSMSLDSLIEMIYNKQQISVAILKNHYEERKTGLMHGILKNFVELKKVLEVSKHNDLPEIFKSLKDNILNVLKQAENVYRLNIEYLMSINKQINDELQTIFPEDLYNKQEFHEMKTISEFYGTQKFQYAMSYALVDQKKHENETYMKVLNKFHMLMGKNMKKYKEIIFNFVLGYILKMNSNVFFFNATKLKK